MNSGYQYQQPRGGIVERCSYEEIEELVDEARSRGIDARRRPHEQWYRVDDSAIACLWWPENRANRARLSHCWVTEEHRGNGLGERLVRFRVTDAVKLGASVIDTFAFRTALFERLGFAPKREFERGTTHLVLDVEEHDDEFQQ